MCVQGLSNRLQLEEVRVTSCSAHSLLPSWTLAAQPRAANSSPAPQMPWRFRVPRARGKPTPLPPGHGLDCSLAVRPNTGCAWGAHCGQLVLPQPYLMVWVPAQLSLLLRLALLQKLNDFSSKRCLTENLPWTFAYAIPSAWTVLPLCPLHLQNLILA